MRAKELYYEDFTEGQQFHSSGSYAMDKEKVIAFAREFDPQLQHIDEAWAKKSTFGELIASGWHTAAATMRLKTETDLFHVAGGLIGLGLETVRWPRPTKPGDTLRLVVTVLGKRLSASKPDKGIIKYKAETLNQRNEVAMEMEASVIVPRRVPA